jgi:hypothetical protein
LRDGIHGTSPKLPQNFLTELRLWEISCVTFPMNESAQVSAVKALSDDQVAEHLRAIDVHRKSIDCHTRGIEAHIKSLLGFGDAEDDVDDPDLLEDDDDDKAFVAELKQLAEEAAALADK